MQTRIALLFVCGFSLGVVIPLPGQDRSLAVPAGQALSGPVVISDDGMTVAVGYHGKDEIVLFDLSSGMPKLFLAGHGAPVRFLAFDESDARLLAATDEEIMIWSLPQGIEEERIPLSIPLPAGPRDYMFDPSRQLLFCSVGSDLYCYSLRQGGLVKKLESKRKKPVTSTLRATLLTQPPSRAELWALDRNEEELLRIDLTHFRVRDKIKIPGAFALAVENRWIAVLTTSPDRTSPDQHTVYLFNEALEKTGIFSVALELPDPGAIDLHFSAPQHLSITAREGLADLDLVTGQSTRFDLQRQYERLFFRRDGSLVLLRKHHLEIIDPWGRCQAQYRLSNDPVFLYDQSKRQLFRLQEGVLYGEDGRQYCQLDTSNGPVVCADIRDGVLAVSDPTGSISLYDLESGQWLRTLSGSGRPYSRLVVLPKHKRIAAFTVTDLVAGLYDWENGTVISWLRPGGGSITALAGYGDRLYLGDESGRINIFSPEDGEKLESHQIVRHPVRAITADQQTLAVGGRSGINVFDLSGFEERYHFLGHDNAIRWLQLTPEGDHLLSVAGDDVIRSWSLLTGKLMAVFQAPGEIPDRAFFRNDPSSVVMSTMSGNVQEPGAMPSSAVDSRRFSPKKHPNLSFSHNGALVAVADPGSGQIGIWETATGTRLQKIQASGRVALSTVQFYGSDEVLIAAGAGGFEYWEARTGKLLKQVDYSAVGLQPGVVFKSPGQDSLWTFQEGGDRIIRMTATTGDIAYSRQVPAGVQLSGLAQSPDGHWLAAAGKDRLYILDNKGVEPPQLIMDIKPSHPVFSPDGRLLVFTKQASDEVVIYDIYQEKVRFRVPGQGAAFLDERRLVVYRVTSSGFSALDIWDCLREGPVATIDVHPGASISSIGAFAGGSTVVTADVAGNLLFWKAPASTLLASSGTGTKEFLIQAFPQRPGASASLVDALLTSLLPKPRTIRTSPPLSEAQEITPHVVTKSTSLRSGAGADKGVIVRLPAGTRVEVMEDSTDPYWARIRFGPHTGWAKKALLERTNQPKETL